MRLAHLIAAATLLVTAAQAQTTYPKMAPLADYMTARDAEITLARSAAPEAISKDATVLVLTSTDFETAVTGTNGFTCYVDRSWAGMLDWPEFWNPKIRAAACLNAVAARSFIPYERFRAKLILAGKSKEEIIAATAQAIAKKELLPIEPGGVCYMMSKTNYLTDQGEHAMPHVMYYTADNGESLGSNLPNSPFIGGNYWQMSPDSYPQMKSFPKIFVSIMMAGAWADGSSAMKM